MVYLCDKGVDLTKRLDELTLLERGFALTCDAVCLKKLLVLPVPHVAY